MEEFSFKTRAMALDRMRGEEFDLLILGGGITGAAVARDATTRGLRVALVEKRDFAWGTSSRSSKLIHGGLRYLENFELGLVFEALAERAHLLKTTPHLVRPLKFFMPVYAGLGRGRLMLSMGMWLYDLLALFRAPGFHQRLSRKKMIDAIPFLKEKSLKGGFAYYDASMWDDQLVIETLRDAQKKGAVVANYLEATAPVWKDDRIVGFRVSDTESSQPLNMEVRAKRVVVCAGPWTDQVGKMLSAQWWPWLKPSKGVHLVFDLCRIPLPGAVVMNHPADGRIAFVIPRPDFGSGVAIVGTTDGSTSSNPEKADIEKRDVDYLMDLLRRYFPTLDLKNSDIISAYVGVRPLMGGGPNPGDVDPVSVRPDDREALQKVSREHYIGRGPGETVIVTGGKYTTHRQMAKEIVDFTIAGWKEDSKKGKVSPLPPKLGLSKTAEPVNPGALPVAIEACRAEAKLRGIHLSPPLLERYGAWALAMMEEKEENVSGLPPDPAGFPCLAAQLRHAIRTEMVLHLEDFYLRRVPLFMARQDHGLPWADGLSRVWAEERGKGEEERKVELQRLREEIEQRQSWRKKLM